MTDGVGIVPVRGQPPDAGRRCVVTPDSMDAGDCEDGGVFLFDGRVCRPACDQGGAYEDESACLTTCLCDASKLRPEVFTPRTECTWLRVLGHWDAGAPDAGECSRSGDARFVCSPSWPFDPSLPSTSGNLPLGIAGVRIACDWSLRPDVTSVACDVFEE